MGGEVGEEEDVAGVHGLGDGSDGGQLIGGDFEEAGVAAGEVAEDAVFVDGGDDVEAAVF